MARRIRRILLVCNQYDNFSLEEDGRLDVRISREYAELNLSNPPVFERVPSTAEALKKAEAGERWDLVITMYNVGEVGVFDFAAQMKRFDGETPIVLLTSFSKEVYRQMEEKDRSAIDYIFCWNGSTDLIIAIIKLLEDSVNAPEDILRGGVQCILLVEDSVRYYSTYLPLLYKLVLQQNVAALRDALNEDQQIFRKRARPKILMATNYEDAVALYNTYKENLLGVISDIGFVMHRNDKPSQEKLDAGVDLCNLIRSEIPKMPILMQSSQESMRAVADRLRAGFLMKRSKTLTHELSEYIGGTSDSATSWWPTARAASSTAPTTCRGRKGPSRKCRRTSSPRCAARITSPAGSWPAVSSRKAPPSRTRPSPTRNPSARPPSSVFMLTACPRASAS